MASMKKLTQWFAKQWALSVLDSANMCLKHYEERKFDRWIGNYCLSCLVEKYNKKFAEKCARKEALDAKVRRALAILHNKED